MASGGRAAAHLAKNEGGVRASTAKREEVRRTTGESWLDWKVYPAKRL